jgi:hypothetical protein
MRSPPGPLCKGGPAWFAVRRGDQSGAAQRPTLVAEGGSWHAEDPFSRYHPVPGLKATGTRPPAERTPSWVLGGGSCLPVYLSVCLSGLKASGTRPPAERTPGLVLGDLVCLSVCLPVCLGLKQPELGHRRKEPRVGCCRGGGGACLSVCLSVRLSVCLETPGTA